MRKYRKRNTVLITLTTLITLSSSFPIKVIIKQLKLHHKTKRSLMGRQWSTDRTMNLTSTFLPFFLLFTDDNLLLFHFQGASCFFLDGLSTSLACITVLISWLISLFLVSLSFTTCSAITPFWSATWAGLTSSVTVIILDFCFSVSYKDANLSQIFLLSISIGLCLHNPSGYYIDKHYTQQFLIQTGNRLWRVDDVFFSSIPTNNFFNMILLVISFKCNLS